MIDLESGNEQENEARMEEQLVLTYKEWLAIYFYKFYGSINAGSKRAKD